MCCIKLSEGGELPYRCCCGCCKLIVAVVFVFIIELLSLMLSIASVDITGIVVSSIITVMFAVTFFKHESKSIRFALFTVYLGRAIVFAIHCVWYFASQNMTTMIYEICKGINKSIELENCWADLSDVFWFVVITYVLIVFSFRLLLSYCLYYYYHEKVLEQHDSRLTDYQELSGQQYSTHPHNNDDNHHPEASLNPETDGANKLV